MNQWGHLSSRIASRRAFSTELPTRSEGTTLKYASHGLNLPSGRISDECGPPESGVSHESSWNSIT